MAGEWKELMVQDFAEVIGGGTPSTKDGANFGGEIPWITPKDLSTHAGRYIAKGERSITKRGLGSSAARILPPGTVLLTTRAPVGYLAIAARELTTNQGFHSLVVRDGFSPEFAYYLLLNDVERLKSFAVGSTFPELSGSTLRKMNYSIPPLCEQRAIAHILGTLDDKIELNREMNETLEAMARALFKSWFIDFDPVHAKAEGRDPGLPADIAALFPDSFQDSELGEIPKGWRVEHLSVVMTFEGGAQPPASEFISEPCEGYVRLVQIRDFYSSSHITFVPDTKKLRKFTSDDIMIARYGSSGNAGESGDSLARICRGLSGAYNVALVKVVPLRPIREYLGYFLRSRAFQSVIKGMGTRSVQSGFRKEDLDVISVVIAPDPVHAAFEQLAMNVWQHTYANCEISRTLATLRDALLPKLLSGELRVRDVAKSERRRP